MWDAKGKVAIVTGSATGVGEEVAAQLAEMGANVVINYTKSLDEAKAAVARCEAAGAEVLLCQADVSNDDDCRRMVAETVEKWGRVDILVNNAGILRDKSFAKGDLGDFQMVLNVHLMGSINCTKAVWNVMRDQAYGRIVMTTSSSGLYGNFGQTNYGSAKMGVIGAMNTLSQEGAKYNIHVNALAPTAGTRMTEGLIPEAAFAMLTPETVTPAVLYLVSDQAPTKTIIAAGAGCYSVVKIHETQGAYLSADEQSPEGIAANWDAISSTEGEAIPQAGFEQTVKFTGMAAEAQGIKLG
jgi:NAD(P)-dependent dehydrogenase (short-subunit alcohol dehydrogenase family)